MKNRIYIVGMGPGKEEMMTGEALKALEEADVIVGYPVYINLLGGRFREKELLSTRFLHIPLPHTRYARFRHLPEPQIRLCPPLSLQRLVFLST